MLAVRGDLSFIFEFGLFHRYCLVLAQDFNVVLAASALMKRNCANIHVQRQSALKTPIATTTLKAMLNQPALN